MNVENLRRLRAHIAGLDPEGVRATPSGDKGCTLLAITTRLIVDSVNDDARLPSPVEWLGMAGSEAEVFFDMMPNCPWASQAERWNAAAGIRRDFDLIPDLVRKAVVLTMLDNMIENDRTDWKYAKAVYNIEAEA